MEVRLASLDTETLCALWRRRGGGSCRPFTDGSIEVLTAGGERIIRASAPVIADWLRHRLDVFT